MKKYLLILSALLLTAVGASAQGYVTTITNTSATWMGATGVYSSVAPERYIDADSGTAEYGTGKILYQAVAGLSAGTYQVTFYAAANFTPDRGFTAASGTGIAQVFANSATQDITVGTSTSVTLDTSNQYTLSCTVGVDGILEYGLQNIAAGGNWYVAQGVSITLISESTPTVEVGELHTCEAEIGHWTTTGNNGTFVLNDWSTEADASGMKVPFCQNWVWEGEDASTVLTTATISHAPFSGLPAGFYEVSLDIRIFSEAGDEIGTGTTFNANTASEDLDQTDTDGHEGSYGNATEVYGTYTLIAEVTEDGTLDISIQLAENPTYNWIAWKNLKVEYLGATIEYEIHEPECSAKVVQPGDEVSIVYECITPDTSNEPTLDTTKSINVGGSAVTNAALECKGYSATVTFTIPEITVGADVTITIPEGLIYWDLSNVEGAENVLSPAATFTVHTPATIEDGDYLIMNEDGNYLGGGLTYGTEAAIIGKPQFIGFEAQENGTYHLDSHQYNNATAHYLGSNLYFDNATPVDWTLVEVEDGYAIYGTADTGTGYLTSNGFQTVATVETTPYTWTLVTMEDVVASMAEATEEAPVDVTALIAAPELKRNSNTSYYPTWTVTGYDGTGTPSNYAFGGGSAVANCAESYHSTNGFNFSQEITLPLAGTYTLSAKGFYRDDNSTTLLLPVLYAGEETSTFPEITRTDEYLGVADNMANAYQEFLLGLHAIDAINIVAKVDGETVTIGFKGEDTSLWQIMGELDLQYLGVVEETVTWEMTTANWGTLILPFDVAADDVPSGLTVYTCDDTTTTTETVDGVETTTTTVVVTAVEGGIAANTPYLVKGNVEEDTYYTFSGTPEEAEGALTQGLLTGTYETLTYSELSALTGTVYLLQNHTGEGEEGVAFYPVTSESTGATLTANHCYLTLSSSSPVRGFISFPNTDDEATGIVAVESDLIASDAIYDLSGRKVSKAVKGVYIQNGKKVLVK